MPCNGYQLLQTLNERTVGTPAKKHIKPAEKVARGRRNPKRWISRETTSSSVAMAEASAGNKQQQEERACGNGAERHLRESDGQRDEYQPGTAGRIQVVSKNKRKNRQPGQH